MQHFYNQPAHVVDELLFAASHVAPLRIATPESGVRILVRADWSRDGQGRQQVAILSGGGAGHEPSHAGFIGQGMLTGIISGSLFASPSVDAVLAAIRETCGSAGCLLIVKNYTGDRLNFGLAAEQARREGLDVAMVIVGDDIALPDSPQPRGIAGTVLVHKVAGHSAQQRASLEEVHAQATRLCERMASLGMALAHAALPGQPVSESGPELGLGIHNESGARQVEPQSAQAAVEMVLTPLMAHLEARGYPQRWIALLNNLGSCSTQEMGVLAHDVITQLGTQRLSHLIGPAPLMTSLDMHGFSITLLAADDALLEALCAPTEAPAWPGLSRIRTPETFSPDLNSADAGLQDNAPQEASVTQALHRVIATLRQAQQPLDALDAKSGDGDAGSSMVEGADAIQRALEAGRLNTAQPDKLFAGIGQCLSQGMGGSSGVLLSILFTAAAAETARHSLVAALQKGVKRMQTYGGARLGDRTMLDALIPALEALHAGQSMQEAAAAARQGADRTAEMGHAQAGRSAYVPESALKGVVDPGAEAVARVFATLAEAL
ncbi:dihydroxyacetone kinase subunit DhaK [Halomonas shantousis]